MNIDGTYRLTITPESVKLHTYLYRAEKGSLLHSALMNREASSLIVASFFTGLLFAYYAMHFTVGRFQFIAFIILFGLLFIFLRMSVFKEKPLEVVFSPTQVIIKYPSFIIKRVEIFGLNRVKSISIQKRILTIENPEGAEIVKKIALQHGTVVPDLTEPVELHLVELQLYDGTARVIYADRDKKRVNQLITELLRFAGFIKHLIDAKEN